MILSESEFIVIPSLITIINVLGANFLVQISI